MILFKTHFFNVTRISSEKSEFKKKANFSLGENVETARNEAAVGESRLRTVGNEPNIQLPLWGGP